MNQSCGGRHEYLREAACRLAAVDRTGELHEDTIPVVFVLLREHLEVNGLKPQYRVTNLYCNWCLHVRLDRDAGAESVLDELSRILSDDTDPNYNDRICEALSLRQLRQELVHILGTIDVKSGLLSTILGWRALLRVLLRSLVDKPLEQRGCSAYTRWAARLELKVPDLSELDRDYITANQIGRNTVFWQLLVMPRSYTLTGPLVLTERPGDFGAD